MLQRVIVTLIAFFILGALFRIMGIAREIAVSQFATLQAANDTVGMILARIFMESDWAIYYAALLLVVLLMIWWGPAKQAWVSYSHRSRKNGTTEDQEE
jgi:hypothetical protein